MLTKIQLLQYRGSVNTASRGQHKGFSGRRSGLISDAWMSTDHAATEMDAFDLFRKLGAGAKFDLKRFGQDAARFKVNITHVAGDIRDKNNV